MNLLDTTIQRLQTEDRVGIMAHLVAGYRTKEESCEVALALARNGADIIEIQIPFSDPTADGPVITAACQEVLKNGTIPRDAFEIAQKVIRETGVPVLLMSYFNILFRWPGGLKVFLDEAASINISGMIVPDIPPEEKDEPYYYLCKEAGLYPVVIVSPNISSERLKDLKPFASGLVYATARVGTTGAASDVKDIELQKFLKKVRNILEIPVAVGFGINSKEQIEGLKGSAQIAIIGTHFLRALIQKGKEGVVEAIKQLQT